MRLKKAINRVTFGYKKRDLHEARAVGWEQWVKNQLNLVDDSECDALIDKIQYTLKYRHLGEEKSIQLGLSSYYKSNKELWKSVRGVNNPPDYLVKAPLMETALVTWTKAIYSKNQINEMMVEFWHNHFNVSASSQDSVSFMLPSYDRNVIRKNALGNFRVFLEDVAKSPCMLYYLDNAYSKSGPANENYARELFELHTLGAMHYYNHLYDDWTKVPGALEGNAEGYIDEDVYEAARAFTGWTIGDGRFEIDDKLPETGEFYYFDHWHDHYQKRILGHEFKSFQSDLADGLKVLDLVAYHKGTAKHLSLKLCKWFVADEPSEELVASTAKVWLAHLKSDDQIARVVEHILMSKEFGALNTKKMKRPNQLVFSLIRHLDLEIYPNIDWFYMFEQMGYKQFNWPLPTGHPDDGKYWLNTGMMIQRWNIVPIVLHLHHDSRHKNVFVEQTAHLPNLKADTILKYWSGHILGHLIWNEEKFKEIKRRFMHEVEWLKDEDFAHLKKTDPDWFEYKLLQMVSTIALMPEFQRR